MSTSARAALPYPALALTGTAVVVGALWSGFGAWWPSGGTDALGTAGALGLVAAWVAHRAGRTAAQRLKTASVVITAHLVGMGARMLLTLVGALVVVVSGRVEKVPFGVAISAVYLALLALEVFVTLRAVRQNHPPQDRENAPGSAPETADDDAQKAPQGDRKT